MRFNILAIVVMLISCQQSQPDPKILDSENSITWDGFTFPNSCSTDGQWFCHIECCNGYSQDTCVGPFSAWEVFSGPYFFFGTAHQWCDQQAWQTCNSQLTKPIFAKSCYWIGGTNCADSTDNSNAGYDCSQTGSSAWSQSSAPQAAY